MRDRAHSPRRDGTADHAAGTRGQAPKATGVAASAPPLHEPHISPLAVLRLQDRVGNQAVQRVLPTGQTGTRSGRVAVQRNGAVLPSTAHLPATLQKLLTGAVAKTTINEAVRQIYDNMFTLTGWTYNASATNTNGARYCDGSLTVGMCESFREAFKYALEQYDALRSTHPVDAIKNGALTIVQNQTLTNVRLVTKPGLTLMGPTQLKGNVYRRVDGTGTCVAEGIDAINAFVFRYHWTLDVNGVNYDPIFHSIGQNNVGAILDANYFDGNAVYLVDQDKPIPTGEFGATFVHLTDFATFASIIDAMRTLYAADSARIDKLLAEGKAKKWVRRHLRVPDEAASAKGIVARITDRATFAEIVGLAYKMGRITRDQWVGYSKIAALADAY